MYSSPSVRVFYVYNDVNKNGFKWYVEKFICGKMAIVKIDVMYFFCGMHAEGNYYKNCFIIQFRYREINIHVRNS